MHMGMRAGHGMIMQAGYGKGKQEGYGTVIIRYHIFM